MRTPKTTPKAEPKRKRCVECKKLDKSKCLYCEKGCCEKCFDEHGHKCAIETNMKALLKGDVQCLMCKAKASKQTPVKSCGDCGLLLCARCFLKHNLPEGLAALAGPIIDQLADTLLMTPETESVTPHAIKKALSTLTAKMKEKALVRHDQIGRIFPKGLVDVIEMPKGTVMVKGDGSNN